MNVDQDYDPDAVARMFEQHRPMLRGVAYRILGSASETDDALQEAWLRLSRSDADAIDNPAGWLTTVVARVCLNMLQARNTRREAPLEGHERPDPAPGPEQEALLGDSVGVALLLVLDTLSPPERLAFVLHDTFGVSFGEIAAILGKTPAATRQLASRARRRLHGADTVDADLRRRREVVDAFLTASRSGDFAELLRLLDPGVVLRADDAVVAFGRPAQVHGAAGVAESFAGRAHAARPAWVDGLPGAVWSAGGAPRVVFEFVVVDGRITSIDMTGEREVLEVLEIREV